MKSPSLPIFRARFHNSQFRVSIHAADCRAAKTGPRSEDESWAEIERTEHATARLLRVRSCRCVRAR